MPQQLRKIIPWHRLFWCSKTLFSISSLLEPKLPSIAFFAYASKILSHTLTLRPQLKEVVIVTFWTRSVLMKKTKQLKRLVLPLVFVSQATYKLIIRHLNRQIKLILRTLTTLTATFIAHKLLLVLLRFLIPWILSSKLRTPPTASRTFTVFNTTPQPSFQTKNKEVTIVFVSCPTHILSPTLKLRYTEPRSSFFRNIAPVSTAKLSMPLLLNDPLQVFEACLHTPTPNKPPTTFVVPIRRRNIWLPLAAFNKTIKSLQILFLIPIYTTQVLLILPILPVLATLYGATTLLITRHAQVTTLKVTTLLLSTL